MGCVPLLKADGQEWFHRKLWKLGYHPDRCLHLMSLIMGYSSPFRNGRKHALQLRRTPFPASLQPQPEARDVAPYYFCTNHDQDCDPRINNIKKITVISFLTLKINDFQPLLRIRIYYYADLDRGSKKCPYGSGCGCGSGSGS